MFFYGECIVKEDVIEQAEFAKYDGLTGLYSRQYFFAQAEKVLSTHQRKEYIVVCSNIVKFKLVNELFGTSAGDYVLKTLGEVVRRWQRDSHGRDVFGRFHSDHFVGCMPLGRLHMQSFIGYCQAVLEKLDLNINVNFTFGIYKVNDENMTVKEMTDCAIVALQSVTPNGSKPYAVYDNIMQDKIRRDQMLAASMKNSLDSGEFQVFYQPMYDFSTKQITRAEALVRWFHSQLGTVRPNEFIPLFERNGMIVLLDLYIWETVCQHQRQCLDVMRPIVPVSVNVSRVDFYHQDIVERLTILLKKYDLPPWVLELEVTESVYMDDPRQMHVILMQLKELGFHILMDDFGSGYSSLNMLMNLPVDTLKIDMLFIRQMDISQRAGDIIGSIVRMAQWLNLETVMEGVETRTQSEYLKNIGCNTGQGYYFSKPISESDFLHLMDEYTPPASEEIINTDYNMSCYKTIMAYDRKIMGLLDLLNGIGLYELKNSTLILLWANHGYAQIWGRHTLSTSNDGWNPIQPADQIIVQRSLEQAKWKKETVSFTYHSIHYDGHSMLMYARAHYLGMRNNGDVYLITFFDLTDWSCL
jgi:diguanylate cyclase (GGDEF)-like protein